ncbi:MAG: hypothetical protein P0Y55_08655 [Candidatus Cohnella colombiensis]|uniref:Lipocalin-like domain-containing protein n=1 Tax=Candidatus Cohnella colombiensis TaxID=3121368 RepID=A0AA95EZZ9_9BACL|nr:MAG: hypothetical protein P0Y55_08640 [Cohnella sp.]WEK56102.1 MAG: hypothetical protein P0Y55_08655 [Cohnella sp.]
MKYFQIIMIAFLFLFVACSNGEKPIEQKDIVGQWIVTNDQVNTKKFTTKYGQIHVLEAMRVQQHFDEGMNVEFLSDGTVKFENVSGKYTLQSQDGFNYISFIGEASESSHPIELKEGKLQVSVFILERV